MPLGSRVRGLAAATLRVVGRAAALSTLTITVSALHLYLRAGHPGGTTVRCFGQLMEPDGPRAWTIVFSGWPGLIGLVAAVLGVPVLVGLTLRRGGLVSRLAWLLLAGWLAGLAWGAADVVLTTGVSWRAPQGTAAAWWALGLIGTLVGLARRPRTTPPPDAG